MFLEDFAKRIVSVVALISFIGCVIASVGCVIVWVNRTDSNEAFYAFIFLSIAVFNLLCRLSAWKFFWVLAAALFFAAIDVEAAFIKTNSTGTTSLIIGHCFVLGGAFISFCTIPILITDIDIKDRKNAFHSVLGLIMIAGSIFIWISGSLRFQAAWIALVFLLCSIGHFVAGQDFALFGITLCIPFYSPFEDCGTSGGCQVGMLAIFCSCIAAVSIHCWFQDRSEGKGRSVRQVLAFGAVVAAVIGLVVVFSHSDLAKKEAYFAVLLVAVSVLNLMADYFGLNALAFAAFTLMFAMIDGAIVNTENASSAKNTTLTLGWSFLLGGAFLSFVAFPVKFRIPNLRDHYTFATFFLGCTAIVGSALLWGDQQTRFQAAWLGLVYIVCGVFDFTAGIDFAFLGAAVLLPPYQPFVGCNGKCETGLFIVWFSLALMVLWHSFRDRHREKYDDISSSKTEGFIVAI